MTDSDNDVLISSNDPHHDLLDFVDDHQPPYSLDTPLTTTATVSSPSKENDGTDEIDLGGDWMENDENAPQVNYIVQGVTCFPILIYYHSTVIS